MDGVALGHVGLEDTGVTVLYFGPEGATASVDVRGGGPGTRETDLLDPHNTVERVHAVVLAGGSAFGLAAADGVMRELDNAGVGFAVFGESVPGPRVPIVPAAVIFDLLVGPTRPKAVDGMAAARAAIKAYNSEATKRLAPAPVGNVGVGTGATAGTLRGGFGHSSLHVDTDLGTFTVAAWVAANPAGSVVDPATGRLYGALMPDEQPGVLRSTDELPALDREALAALPTPAQRLEGMQGHGTSSGPSALNTTIGAVATDAPLTKAQAKRLALAGHDGIARAVRPAHSPLDGDTLFGLSTAKLGAGQACGVDTLTLAALSDAAAKVVEAAIVNAVLEADPGLGWQSFSSLGKARM